MELAPLLARAEAVALGPGLGRHAWGAAMLDAALAEPRRLVLDADALNGLAERGDWTLREAVLTPHPGEAARLLATSTQAVQDDRFAAAEALRDRTGSVVVLKGAGTIVAAPGTTTRLLPGARPAMASGGMGDVLTGIIAALMAQGMAATDAACTGAALHARAADSEAPRVGAYGLVATDLIGSLGRLRSDVTDG
ncbi:MAG: NAD(P)H-hydrate dehydratase [Proteobacteria bacterium SW_6_67_9]|nr:MAG: NAD(P)H-hydrate dehydratase [Proteobacteria bacterium SW_6_67_9]